MADPGGRENRCSNRLQRVPARNPASATLARGTHLHQYPPLDRNAARRPLRSDGAARTARRGNPRLLPPAARLICAPGHGLEAGSAAIAVCRLKALRCLAFALGEGLPT